MDFDYLKNLFETDPEAFEAERERRIDEAISKWPEEQQERMRRFQFRIDRELRNIKDPFVRANRAYYMMVEKLGELNDAWNGHFPAEKREKAAILHLFKA